LGVIKLPIVGSDQFYLLITPKVCFIRIVYLGYGGEVKPITYLYILTPGYNNYNRMNEYDLTEDEMREMINISISKHYSKMLKDEKRITSYNYHLYSDLLSFCMEQFLTKKNIKYQYKVCVTDDAVLNYMGRSMSLNLRSSTSPYWSHIRRDSYNYRGLYLAETDKSYVNGDYDEITINEDDDYGCMLIQLEKLDFFHKPLITDYYLKGMTYDQLNKKYGIALRHLRQAISEGLEIIKTECRKTQTL
jgi:hypothetical protein